MNPDLETPLFRYGDTAIMTWSNRCIITYPYIVTYNMLINVNKYNYVEIFEKVTYIIFLFSYHSSYSHDCMIHSSRYTNLYHCQWRK